MASPVQWFNRGKEKLSEAESEISQGRPQNAFQAAREAAEILLKSLLVAQGVPEHQFISHDHEWLCQQTNWSKFPQVNGTTVEQAAWELEHFQMQNGSWCSTKMTGGSRYPRNITPYDAQRSIQIAKRILSEVQKEFYSSEQETNYDRIFDLLLILGGLMNAMFLSAFQVWATARPGWEGWMRSTAWILGSTAPLLYVMPIFSLAKACPRDRKQLKTLLRLATYGGTLAILNVSYSLFAYSCLTLTFLAHPQAVDSLYQIPYWATFAVSFVVMLFLIHRLAWSQETTNSQKIAAACVVFASYITALFLWGSIKY